MNAPGPAPQPPPPPPSSQQPSPVITSLTPQSTQKEDGTTSLAEALATSVADYACENRRKNVPAAVLPPNPNPPKSTTAITYPTANGNPPTSAAHPQITGSVLPNATASTAANGVTASGQNPNNGRVAATAAPPSSSTSENVENATPTPNDAPSRPTHPKINTPQRVQLITPSASASNAAKNNGVAMAAPKSNPRTRIVSGEHPKPARSPVRGPPQLKLTPQTASVRSSTATASSTASTAATSSMSSAVADLANGMFNFQPSRNAGAGGSSCGGGSLSGSSHGSGNRANPQRAGGHGGSAPIISGTAAAVLALQSTFYAAPAVVSTVDAGENAAGGAPDPLRHPKQWGGPQGGARIKRTATPQDSPTSTGSPATPASHGTAGSKSSFPTRYSDGAPIIAGTAAAQMEAIATATAARVASIGGAAADGAVAAAVAGLAPVGGIAAGGPSPPTRSHGFTPGAHYCNGALSTGASPSRTAAAAVGPGGVRKALSWVDHGGGGAGPVKVTPDDGGAPRPLPARRAPAPARRRPATAPSLKGADLRPGGGMDILAEITCHAPPMSVPAPAAQAPAPAPTGFRTSSYQPQFSSASIPSYQEIYQQQQHHQQRRQHQGQAKPTAAFPSPAAPSSGKSKRVSAIPSYQEIYREMGLSSPHQPLPRQPQHASLSEKRAGAQRGISGYSIKEVPVGHAAPSSMAAAHASPNGTRSSTGASHAHPNGAAGRRPGGAVGDAGAVGGGGARTMSHHYAHRAPTTRFGHAHRDDVEEGKELYTRKDLVHLGGHLCEHKDVHGNMREGCDSLIIGNMEKDIREGDGLAWFLYSTDRANGGGALCQSYHKKRPVRVFRSSLLSGRFAPPYLDVEDDEEEDTDVAYRYDGLYMVRAVWDASGSETESLPIAGLDGWQTYFVVRVPKKPLEKEKMEAGLEYNFVGLQELWSLIQKMKGVKRPKKFEIPQPPVKLSSLKRNAITGVYRDRKCPGWVRPVPKVAAPVAPKSLPQAPATQKTKPSTSERKQREEAKAESESSSSSEEEEETKACPATAAETDNKDDSDSDSLQQQQVRQHTILSARTPPRALMSRPRLNSVLQPKKPEPMVNDEEEDSSDESEASNSTSQIAAAATARRKKRKKLPQSPAKKIQTSNVNPALSDLCSFFPKRASAARAEAANRNMFGKKTAKRKSSETTKTSSSAKQPLHSVPAGAVAAGTRKKAKVQQRRRRDRSSSSSSSEQQSDSDVIDQSILTVGSRVLVMYKCSLFKATIRKRRFKNNSHDFLIHYDGNKRTNVHWVALDKIGKILEIAVLDTAPKRKRHEEIVRQASASSAGSKKKSREGNNNGKRKAFAVEQEIHDNETLDHGDGSKSVTPDELSPDEPRSKRAAVQSKEDRSQSINIEVAPSNKKDEDMSAKHVDHQVEGRESNCETEAPTSSSEKEAPTPLPAAEGTHKHNDGRNKQLPDHVELATKERGDLIATITKKDSIQKLVPYAKEDEEESDLGKKKDNPVLESYVDVAIEGGNNGDAKSECENTTKTQSRKADLRKSCSGSGPEDEQMEAAELNFDTATNGLVPGDSGQPDKGEEKNTPKSAPISNNNETTAAAAPVSRKPSDSEALSADVTKDPLQILAEEAESDILDDPGGSDKDDVDEDNSTTGCGNAAENQEQASSANGESTCELKFPVGGHVYVEYRQIFYSSSILKTRRRRRVTEYLVHYEGYKKASNRWVKENALHEVNASTTQRFEEQRLIPPDILYESPQPPVFNMTTRRKKATGMGRELQSSLNDSTATHLSTATGKTHKKPPPSRRMRSDTSGSHSPLETIQAGVAFLPGSMVFVEWSGALYLAKMVRKRYSGEKTEYLISYEGYKSNHDAWVSIHKIYEVNPQTKRVFKQINSEILRDPRAPITVAGPGAKDDEHRPLPKRRSLPPPGPRRRETRRKMRDDRNAAIDASNGDTAPTSKTPASSTRNKGLNNSQSSKSSRGASSSSASRATHPTVRQASQIDMEGIEPGVEFLPGSCLFAEYKGDLCLAKMLKKRGKGDYMEYLLQYNSNVLKTKKEQSEDAEDYSFWVSTSLVYEINPQTKRMFRKLSGKSV